MEKEKRLHGCCPTCICNKRAPVQSDYTRKGKLGYGPGSITWTEHLLAWSAYAGRYGKEQSAETIADRGGFGYQELIDFLGHNPETWEPRQ